MKIKIVVFAIVLTHSLFAQSNLKFEGANIYQSNQFIKKDFYIVDGNFTFVKPEIIDSIINLKGKYIIPPFGDAHTHNLDREWQMSFLPKKYIDEGTIYVLNLTSKLDAVKKLRPHFQKKNTIDVAYSNQGLTSTLGHPFMAYEPFAMGLAYKDWKKNTDSIRKSRIDENNSYIFIDSKKDLNKKLPSFFQEKPDVVKIFLLDSRNYRELYKNDTLGDGGLDVEIAKKIIRKAHKRDLKVYAHIETAFDFEQGIKAGVDYFAHMPGYGWSGYPSEKSKYYVTDKVLTSAIKNKIGIIPTLQQAVYNSKDSVQKVEFIKDFLSRFKNKGGKILIGSDFFGKTLNVEIEYLINLGIFTPKEILHMLCYDTPKTIFPKRKIGEIKEGCEGSFLVLEENPLENINVITLPKQTIKQGFFMN